MERSELKLGKIYTLAGLGEMKLVESCGPSPYQLRRARNLGRPAPEGEALLMAQHGGWHYWASLDQFVREATPAALAARDEVARAKGVACKDPTCWCRGSP